MKKLSREQVRKIINESLIQEGALDYLPESAKRSIHDYIKSTVSQYLKDNAASIGSNAPWGLRDVTSSLIAAKSDEIGLCAANLIISI